MLGDWERSLVQGDQGEIPWCKDDPEESCVQRDLNISGSLHSSSAKLVSEGEGPSTCLSSHFPIALFGTYIPIPTSSCSLQDTLF